MINKTLETCQAAVADVFDGATIMFGGFGDSGLPGQLIEALRQQGATNLVVINNGCGRGDHAMGGLFVDGRVRKLYCSFPNYPGNHGFSSGYLSGNIELELVPQGTLVERIRAGGAGLGGFYTPTGAGTELAKGKEHRTINGREYVFETPLTADFTFLRARRADRMGNLGFQAAGRNFNSIMATAGKVVIAEVDELVPVGEISPEEVHVPGIFVDRVIKCERHPMLLPSAKGAFKK